MPGFLAHLIHPPRALQRLVQHLVGSETQPLQFTRLSSLHCGNELTEREKPELHLLPLVSESHDVQVEMFPMKAWVGVSAP